MEPVGYVTLEEANLYIITRYLATDTLRVEWEALTDEDKSVYLLRAYDVINLLPFRGRKKEVGQIPAFPRCPYTEIPEAIKWAQIENAITLSDTTAQEDAVLYDRLWQYGVSSYRIGNLSESSSTGEWGRSSGVSGASSVSSTKARDLLTPYLMGGFRIE